MPCRVSPPSRGEIIRSTAFANHKRWKADGAPKLPISSLEGEMSGRTEGCCPSNLRSQLISPHPA
ncbi:MAG: hypothetical protein E5X40_00575 [Mesorhizobium sp.]|nr:hypothetical protein EOA86_14475 [Mesorhizobium sp. M5C.F.Ca.IN.020.32.2.1]RUV55666.1 hypothetical protein EOA85_20815 [Mesorhizobium sp. M5C.F.Ca.IN.020.29.1.1]RUV68737.1 hypothetical protein EOA88_29025 [Mesorhizobium sp. M5C.F.Ca.IN.020.14.1.1]RWE87691.1 MAG: hypothetical protein EOS49_09540 [Mesorhizobium sp.]RWG40293.1 MAG: hypothetical protein EOQ62_29850 [Mesorhizobium sp.]